MRFLKLYIATAIFLKNRYERDISHRYFYMRMFVQLFVFVTLKIFDKF